jgi:hypothetical protein
MRVRILSCALLPVLAVAGFSGQDAFEDGVVGGPPWAVLSPVGSGARFTEESGALRFQATGSGTAFQYFLWGQASYDEDFDLSFRTANTTMPGASGEFAGIGVEIYPEGSSTTRLNLRHGSYWLSGFGPSRDLLVNFFNGAFSIPALPVQPASAFPKAGAMRLSYDGAAKVFTVYVDERTTDGIQWTELSTFGVSGAGNAAHNLDFGLTAGGLFNVYIYARSDGLEVDGGSLSLDDFQAFDGGPGDPVVQRLSAHAITFGTQLGESYTLSRRADLSSNSAFTPVRVQGEGEERLIVPADRGQAQFFGTGAPVRLIDSTQNQDAAFYQIVRP